jgi:hypothetical protein
VRINVAVPEAHVTAPVLDAALESVTRLNESMLDAGEVPPFDEVRDSIRWRPEPPGDEHFDHAKVVLGRKWGDCDDMAPYAAATMRHTGEDPGARAIVKRSGPTRWHAVVERSDGSIRDPSKETGMGQKTMGVVGAGLPSMMRQPASVVGGSFLARPQLALRPLIDRPGTEPEAWQARADLPWHWLPGKSPTDVAMVSLHASPVSSEAIVGACEGLLELGEANDVDDDVLDRVSAISAACDGVNFEDIEDEYGPEHALAAGQLVGSFFGSFGRKLGRMVKRINPLKLASQAVTFIPGVGPVAHMALDAASPALQHMLARGHHLPPPGHPLARAMSMPGLPGLPGGRAGAPLAELRIFR